MRKDLALGRPTAVALNFKVECDLSTSLIILVLVVAVAFWLFDALRSG